MEAFEATIGHATLTSLSPDCLARVLQFLSIADIHNCLLSSRVLHTAMHDERVWHSLCQNSWGSFTTLCRWVLPPSPGVPTPVRYRSLQPPCSYRDLYYLLHRTAPVVGLWRLVGEGPVGALIAFSWTAEGIKGEELQYEDLAEDLECVPYRSVCPRRGVSVRVEVVDEEHAVVKDVAGSQRHMAMQRSESAEAAASVALSHPPQLAGSMEVLGSSPLGSFEYEWLQFMSANVSSGRAKQRRKAAKSPAGPGASPGAVVHHLKRVQRPVPTPKHPLAGLWAAECGGRGIEVLRLVYDFTGTSARIVAIKVTGNQVVPAGQQAWVALAAPIPPPWSTLDQETVAAHQARWGEEERARRDLHEWMLDEEEEGAAAASSSSIGWRGQQQQAQLQVVAIHEARIQVAGAQGGGTRWTEGRLWVLSSSGLGILVDEELLGLRRIDADVAAIFA